MLPPAQQQPECLRREGPAMKIDWFTFVAQVINFLVLVYLLKRFLYAPITAAMQAREDHFEERIQDAARSKEDAERRIGEYRQRAEELENARHKMFDAAKQEVEASRQQLLKQARTEVDSRREDWQAALDREQDTLTQMLKKRCGDQVTSATRQAIRHLADADLEEQMLRSFIQELKAGDAPKGKQDVEGGRPRAIAYSAFEISTIWRERLKEAVKHSLHIGSLEFRINTDIVCGLELHVGSQKFGWSVEEYLSTLEEEFDQLVQRPTP